MVAAGIFCEPTSTNWLAATCVTGSQALIGTAGRERHDDADRSRRVALGERVADRAKRDKTKRHEGDEPDGKRAAQPLHEALPCSGMPRIISKRAAMFCAFPWLGKPDRRRVM